MLIEHISPFRKGCLFFSVMTLDYKMLKTKATYKVIENFGSSLLSILLYLWVNLLEICFFLIK